MLQSLKTSLERELELDGAEKDICRLEQEARKALEDNKRYCTDLPEKYIFYMIVHHIFYILL